MRDNYDLSKGKRGAVSVPKGKTRITIYVDDAVLVYFKREGGRVGKGYQTLLNEALAIHIGKEQKPLTADVVRTIVREELAQAR